MSKGSGPTTICPLPITVDGHHSLCELKYWLSKTANFYYHFPSKNILLWNEVFQILPENSLQVVDLWRQLSLWYYNISNNSATVSVWLSKGKNLYKLDYTYFYIVRTVVYVCDCISVHMALSVWNWMKGGTSLVSQGSLEYSPQNGLSGK